MFSLEPQLLIEGPSFPPKAALAQPLSGKNTHLLPFAWPLLLAHAQLPGISPHTRFMWSSPKSLDWPILTSQRGG